MKASYGFDLVCIGSGPAGQRATVQAAELGKRAAVIEKRRCVGGVCIDTGTIPSKTLRDERQLRRNDVTLISGAASFVDQHTVVVHAEDG
jgi:pyruvate/2-oxoglutarate dehydrogenase complex dihydrolipoamide dehydrogenase (E3) component